MQALLRHLFKGQKHGKRNFPVGVYLFFSQILIAFTVSVNVLLKTRISLHTTENKTNDSIVLMFLKMSHF